MNPDESCGQSCLRGKKVYYPVAMPALAYRKDKNLFLGKILISSWIHLPRAATKATNLGSTPVEPKTKLS